MSEIRLSGVPKQTKQTITTTAAKLPATKLSGRKTLVIKNTGSETVYLGNASVTTTDGYTLEAGDVFPAQVNQTFEIYGLVQNGTGEVRILESF